jgi:hypothetical protein
MASVIEEWKNKEFWWNDTDRKTEVLLEKPAPVPLYPLQILEFEFIVVPSWNKLECTDKRNKCTDQTVNSIYV